MELNFTYSPWLLAICLPLGALAALLMYRRTREMLKPGLRYFLTFVRFLIFSLVAFLLLEPLIGMITKVKSPPIIAVLHDDSESLRISRDSNFTIGTFPGVFSGFMKELDTPENEVQFYSLGNQIQQSSPDSLTFRQKGTNISAALSEIKKQYRNQNLGAIVLVSDGISTAGTNPLYGLDDIKQPIYTVLLGDTNTQKDLKIAEVLVNDIAYLKNQSPIKLRVESEGYPKSKITATLKHKGKVLGVQTVDISTSNPNADINFLILPEETGMLKYDLSISSLAGEVTYQNNYKSVFINVLETKVKVGVFAGSPHPDLGAIRKALTSDERYDLVEFIHKGPNSWYESPQAINLSEIDLFVLHNFPFSPADGPIVSDIIKQVKNHNAPLMMFVGQFTHLPTAQPLNPYMALTPKVISDGAEEANVTFSPEYENHSTFTFERDWLSLFNSAPPIFRNRSDWKAKGDAKVYGTAKIKSIQLNYPVFALQDHLSKKNMVFIGENIWRMRSHAFMERESFEAFDQWLFSTIQWLMVRVDKRKFQVRPNKNLYSGDQKVNFKGQIYDDSYNPVRGAEIKLSLKNKTGTENIYYLSEYGDAQYLLELVNLEEGTYSYAAEGKKGDLKLGTDKGQFSVGKSNIEHFRLKADNGLMEQLALRTEGKFVYGKDLGSLSTDILGLEGLKPVVDLRKSRLGINEVFWILALILALLTLEWVVRKINSLD